MVVAGVAVLVLIITVSVPSMWAMVESVRRGGEPEEESYTPITDTGGPARGQAQAFSELLRARGLACSDEDLEKVFSRGCYRKDFDHDVQVEFLGPVDGTLGSVKINVDFIGAEDQAHAHRAFDELVGDFAEASELSAADAELVRTKLAGGGNVDFSTYWGRASLRRTTEARASITLRRGSWAPPDLISVTLPGNLSTVEWVAVQHDFRCDQQGEWHLDCTKGDDENFKIVASRSVLSGLNHLYVSAATGPDDTAMDIALADAGSVLDALGGSRAAAVKGWFTQHRTAAGGMAYVGGLQTRLAVTDTRQLHIVSFDLLSPCLHSKRGRFC